jgi:hypothetical protein
MLKTGPVGNPARPFSHLKHPSKVVGLACIGYVDHPLRRIPSWRGCKPKTNGSEIRGGVIKTTITLLHNHRQRIAVFAGHALKEHALGAVVGHQQVDRFQPVQHRRQIGVVERFASLSQANIKPVVQLLKLTTGLVAQQAPCLERHRIPTLQLHHLIAGGGLKIIVIIKAFFRFAIKRRRGLLNPPHRRCPRFLVPPA